MIVDVLFALLDKPSNSGLATVNGIITFSRTKPSIVDSGSWIVVLKATGSP